MAKSRIKLSPNSLEINLVSLAIKSGYSVQNENGELIIKKLARSDNTTSESEDDTNKELLKKISDFILPENNALSNVNGSLVYHDLSEIPEIGDNFSEVGNVIVYGI